MLHQQPTRSLRIAPLGADKKKSSYVIVDYIAYQNPY